MPTTSFTRNRFHIGALPLLLALLLLPAFAALSPAAAGGLSDFFNNKGGRENGGQRPSANSDNASERRGDTSSDHGSSSGIDPWQKRKPRDTGSSTGENKPRQGETRWDTYRRGEQSSPNSGRPAGGSTPRWDEKRRPDNTGGGRWDSYRGGDQTTYSHGRPSADSAPRRNQTWHPASAGGGLYDFFHRPNRHYPPRPSEVPVPLTVIVHFGDPWYYPYDRYFHQHYCPYVLHDWDIWVGASPYWGWWRDSYREETTADALRDIERGWRERDYFWIDRHVGDNAIVVYEDGEYTHSLTPAEFRAMTLQAFLDVRTLSFRFIDNWTIGSRELRAVAEHRFLGPDDSERCVRLRFALRRRGGHWYFRSIDLDRGYGRISYENPPPGEQRFLAPAGNQTVGVSSGNVVLARAITESETPGFEDLIKPSLALATPPSEVTVKEPRMLVAMAGTPALGLTATPRETSLRIVCVSRSLPWKTIRAAGNPVKIATLTCVVLKAAPRMNLVPGSRQTSDVLLSMTPEGLVWKVRHHGDARDLESGMIAAASLKAAPDRQVRVVLDRITTPLVGARAGEQRVTLFSRSRWDYQTTLVALPGSSMGKQIRTELVVSSGGN